MRLRKRGKVMVDFAEWTKATGALPAGVQRAFSDVLKLASEGKITLNYDADNYGGGACLVNASRQMLANTQDASVSPSAAYYDVVIAFDTANSRLADAGVNTERRMVSPLAAETLLRNFGPLKPMVIEVDSNPVPAPKPFVEPSDDDLLNDWLTAIQDPAPETVTHVADPVQVTREVTN